jgi:hypothetical protein
MEQSREAVIRAGEARCQRFNDPVVCHEKNNRLDSQEVLFAVIRKMIVTLNALLRDNTEWRPAIA